MINYKVDQKIHVLDNADGKKRPCKVVQVDSDKKKILIHYIKWSKSFDEWISFDSSRITVEEEEIAEDELEDSFEDAEDDSDIGSAIGQLLRSVDEESKKVISKYDVRLGFEGNLKNFNKFSVSSLEHCAIDIKIKIKDDGGKKLFNKNLLVKNILMQIEAHFPIKCVECQESYMLNPGDAKLFSCYKCLKPSHNCEVFKKLHSCLPPLCPTGFVWLCSECHAVPDIHVNDLNLKEHHANDHQTKVTQPAATTDLITAVADEISPELLRQKQPVCRYYLRKECKHGRKGQDCEFDHPKMCFNFIKRGDKAGGCNKGKNCTYLHPPLCRGSNGNRMVCSRDKCNFYHLKGTELVSGGKNYRKQEIENLRSDRTSSKNGNSSQSMKKKSIPVVDCNSVPPQRDVGLNQRASYSAAVADPFIPSSSDTVRRDDFLELKLQMKTIQEQFQWLITNLRMTRQPFQMGAGWPPQNLQN